MSEAQNARPRGRWRVVVLSLVLFPAVYFGVLALVRAYVDHQIERNAGQTLPQFAVADRSGAMWQTDQVAGKVVVLHFFRSFCGACGHEAPAIRRLEGATDPEDVQLLGVMTDRLNGFTEADTEATLQRYGFRHPVLMADEDFADAFHGAGWAQVTPVTYIADGKGVIRSTLRGPQTFATLAAAVRGAGGTVAGGAAADRDGG